MATVVGGGKCAVIYIITTGGVFKTLCMWTWPSVCSLWGLVDVWSLRGFRDSLQVKSKSPESSTRVCLSLVAQLGISWMLKEMCFSFVMSGTLLRLNHADSGSTWVQCFFLKFQMFCPVCLETSMLGLGKLGWENVTVIQIARNRKQVVAKDFVVIRDKRWREGSTGDMNGGRRKQTKSACMLGLIFLAWDSNHYEFNIWPY